MSKRKLILVLMSLLAIGSGWMIFSYENVGHDEAEFRKLTLGFRILGEAYYIHQYLPSFFDRPYSLLNSRIGPKLLDRKSALLASGYMTNTAIMLSNTTVAMIYGTNGSLFPFPIERNIVIKLAHATPHYQFYSLFDVTNSDNGLAVVIVTCRAQDVPLYQKALSDY